eukprot:g53222.t1
MYSDIPDSRSLYDSEPVQPARTKFLRAMPPAYRGLAAVLAVLVVVVFTTAFALQSRTATPVPINARAAPGAISVKGRYLVYPDGSRFIMKGIAFPVVISSRENTYNVSGWIAVLEQLAALTDINTVRLYNMDCRSDYSKFIKRAEELGIYIIVPFTAIMGDGALGRDFRAPICWTSKLYHYGVDCINNFAKYPNVLGGMIGNEVMSDLKYWPAAPCVAAYARDLKRYMASANVRKIPLIYATQHSAIGAVMSAEDNVRNTLEYLTCDPEASIDIYGINVESWCSTKQTFEKNEDGSTSPYYSLWKDLNNVSTPLVFSEMGCSKALYNRDNLLKRYVRDWNQVTVVLNQMADIFSGFCAYTYDGAPLFRMMDGNDAWNGRDVLKPGEDFYNFANQLKLAKYDPNVPAVAPAVQKVACNDTKKLMETTCDFYLYPMEWMPSYFQQTTTKGAYYSLEDHGSNFTGTYIVFLLALLALIGCYVYSSFNKRPASGLVTEGKYNAYQSRVMCYCADEKLKTLSQIHLHTQEISMLPPLISFRF